MPETQRSIGIHVSIAGEVDLAVDRAFELGCTGAFQIFTCSPRRWDAKPLDPSQVKLFQEKVTNKKFTPFVHMPYMPNLASPESRFYSDSVDVLIREIKRSDELGVRCIVLHFGSHMGSTIQEGQRRIVAACRRAIKKTEGSSVRLLLENSAGVKNSVGSRFEDILRVINGIGVESRTGVCIDTCHLFAAGYDIRTREMAKRTMAEFDSTIGLQKLHLIHANDSKSDLGEGSDRHEHIGLGKIGDTGFESFLGLEEIRSVPIVLETPIDKRRNDKENIAHIKQLLNS